MNVCSVFFTSGESPGRAGTSASALLSIGDGSNVWGRSHTESRAKAGIPAIAGSLATLYYEVTTIY